MEIFSDRLALEAICRRHDVARLSLFGSVLKGTATDESDIDLLVEFNDAARPTFLDMARMEIELSELLGGRKVDLRTPQDLSRYFRSDVLASAELQYAA
jgi:uncharacterized protein